MLISHYSGISEHSAPKKCALFLSRIFSEVKAGKGANKVKLKNHLHYLLTVLEGANSAYRIYRQEDAAETLLSILREVEKQHPQVRGMFDIAYETKCKCHHSTVRSTERIMPL